MRAKGPCESCFHYGKSIVTKKVECVIKDKVEVCPNDCREFVPIKESRR